MNHLVRILIGRRVVYVRTPVEPSTEELALSGTPGEVAFAQFLMERSVKSTAIICLLAVAAWLVFFNAMCMTNGWSR